MKSAEHNDPSDSDWTINGAGYLVNHTYGFGRTDAQAAVNAALSDYSIDSDLSTQTASNPNLPIPDDDSTGVTDTINISDEFIVDFVEIHFSAADHTHWGDLEVVLTSPEGTESVLSEAHISGSSATYDNWRFGSVRQFGES